MNRAAISVLVVGLLGGTAGAAERLSWRFEGYSKVVEAAAEAKKSRKRLLVGLSGSDT
ncbi:MAG: hypothetical protein ACE5JG_05155 [Planctomycetota bacterium]